MEKFIGIDEYCDISESIAWQDEIVQSESNQQKIMFDQLSAQIRKMIETTLSHNEQHTGFFFQLADSNLQCLKTVAVAKDERRRNCLFCSLGHQLFGHKIKVPNTSK